MFGCLTQHQICRLGICLLDLFGKKGYQKGAGNPQLIYTGVFFMFIKSIMYSQTQLIQTLETPQKVSAGIKRVMLFKSISPFYYNNKIPKK